MTRITLGMDMKEMLWEMSRGNPGGLRVCVDLLSQAYHIDPDSALGGLGVVLQLDTLGIYENRIWMLYKDVCGQDLAKMMAVLRGWQLGLLTEEHVAAAVDASLGHTLDLDDILARVQEQLPRFGAWVLENAEGAP